jgi:hypothetical protein
VEALARRIVAMQSTVDQLAALDAHVVQTAGFLKPLVVERARSERDSGGGGRDGGFGPAGYGLGDHMADLLSSGALGGRGGGGMDLDLEMPYEYGPDGDDDL